MALPVDQNTIIQQQMEKDAQKRRSITNLPPIQPGNQLPLIPQANQGPLSPSTAPQQQQAPQPAPPTVQGPQPAQQQPSGPTFTAEQATALAATPPPTIPAPPELPKPPALPTPPAIQQTPVQQPAQQQVGTPDLSQQVLEAQQKKALEGFQSPEQDLLNQQLNRLLSDPSLGRDPAVAKQQALEDFDRQQADAIEALRQQTGGIAGSGQRDEMLLATALAGVTERNRLAREIDIQEQNQKRQELLEALGIGSDLVQQQMGINTQNITNLINASGGALGFAELASRENILLNQQEFEAAQNGLQRDHQIAMQNNDINAARDNLGKQLEFEANQARMGREFTAEQNNLNRALQESLAHLDIQAQQTMLDLKSKIDKDLLLTQQDFQGSQAELDRLMQKAIQEGNIQAQFDLQQAQNEFDALQQESDQKFKMAQQNAAQAWQTDQLLTEQEWKSASQLLNIEAEKALQNNDILAQKDIAEMQANLQLKIQTQNMTHDEKMANLNAQLQEAAAAGDFERQKQLMTFAHMQELQKIDKEQGFAQSMAYLNNNLDIAKANNDFANMKVLEQMKFDHELTMHNDNMKINEMKIALEQQGLDMAQVEQQFNQIMAQVEAGQLAPDAGVKFLQEKLPPDLAAELEPPDPNAWQQALAEDFLMQQYQFALTHGGLEAVGEISDTGEFLGLKDEHLQQFNDFNNNTIYGTTEGPVGEILQGINSGELNALDEIGGSESSPIYQAIFNAPSTVDFTFDTNQIGTGTSARKVFTNMPKTGGFFRYNGKLYQLSKKETDNVAFSTDSKIYTIQDPVTGRKFTINTRDGANAWNKAFAG